MRKTYILDTNAGSEIITKKEYTELLKSGRYEIGVKKRKIVRICRKFTENIKPQQERKKWVY